MRGVEELLNRVCDDAGDVWGCLGCCAENADPYSL